MTTTVVPGGSTYTGIIAVGDDVVLDQGASSVAVLVFGTETVDGITHSPDATTPAIATGSIVEHGGNLLNDGEVVDATVAAGGTLLDDGSISSDGMIYGNETLVQGNRDVGAQSTGDTVYLGGTITVGFVSHLDDATVAGLVVVQGGGVMTDGTIAGGTLDATGHVVPGGGAELTGDLTFSGAGGRLELSSYSADDATILGFGRGDEITIVDAANLSLSVSGDTVVAGGLTLDIAGASSDGLVFGLVDAVPTIECVCFLAGTAIAVPDGTRAVETLGAGDLVLTADGEAHPVRWLGRQTVATRFADPARVAPVRIIAGALGENLPVRDLHVSPDHAIMVDGTFVQAGALINGVSITREDKDLPDVFVYYHVELDSHALILAEGVAAETFIDNVERLAFDNWDWRAGIDEAAVSLHEMPLPRAKAHRQVPPALRARLLARGSDIRRIATAAIA